jgi:hypothetical protein
MQSETVDGSPPTQSRAYKVLVRRNPAIRLAFSGAIVAALVLTSLTTRHPGSAAAAADSPAAKSAISNTSKQPAASAVSPVVPSPTPSAAPPATASAAPSATAKPTPSLSTPAPSTAAPAPAAPTSFASAVAAIVDPAPSHGAVAVTDLTTGASSSYADGGHLFDTASIVKLDILSTLLYQHQQSGQPLTASEQSYATTMIENSDNDSATALFDDIGDVAGLTAGNQAFGLTDTTVGAAWGLTLTDPTDQIKLLKQVFTSDSVLTADSQSYIQGLMSNVESDQRWGVSAAASPGTGFLVKNGWLPDSTTGLWTINSIGEVTYDGHLLLIAVQTDGNSDMDTGVAFNQKIAAAAAQSLVANE